MPIPRLAVSLSLMLLVACTSSPGDQPTTDDETPSGTPSGVAADAILVLEEGAVADGPGISVQDALEHVDGGPVLVNGALFIDAEGTVLLCDAVAESFPPQCGGTRLEVQGLDPASQPDLQEADGVMWLERTQLFGTVHAAD